MQNVLVLIGSVAIFCFSIPQMAEAQPCPCQVQAGYCPCMDARAPQARIAYAPPPACSQCQVQYTGCQGGQGGPRCVSAQPGVSSRTLYFPPNAPFVVEERREGPPVGSYRFEGTFQGTFTPVAPQMLPPAPVPAEARQRYYAPPTPLASERFYYAGRQAPPVAPRYIQQSPYELGCPGGNCPNGQCQRRP